MADNKSEAAGTSGAGTAATVTSGAGLAAWLTAAGYVDPTGAVLIAGAAGLVVGAAAEWARDRQSEGSTNLLISILGKLG